MARVKRPAQQTNEDEAKRLRLVSPDPSSEQSLVPSKRAPKKPKSELSRNINTRRELKRRSELNEDAGALDRYRRARNSAKTRARKAVKETQGYQGWSPDRQRRAMEEAERRTEDKYVL